VPPPTEDEKRRNVSAVSFAVERIMGHKVCVGVCKRGGYSVCGGGGSCGCRVGQSSRQTAQVDRAEGCRAHDGLQGERSCVRGCGCGGGLQIRTEGMGHGCQCNVSAVSFAVQRIMGHMVGLFVFVWVWVCVWGGGCRRGWKEGSIEDGAGGMRLGASCSKSWCGGLMSGAIGDGLTSAALESPVLYQGLHPCVCTVWIWSHVVSYRHVARAMR
jgi:hypothetical protein